MSVWVREREGEQKAKKRRGSHVPLLPYNEQPTIFIPPAPALITIWHQCVALVLCLCYHGRTIWDRLRVVACGYSLGHVFIILTWDQFPQIYRIHICTRRSIYYIKIGYKFLQPQFVHTSPTLHDINHISICFGHENRWCSWKLVGFQLSKVGGHQWSNCVLFWLSTNLVFWFSLSVLRIHKLLTLYTSSLASSWRLSEEENPLWAHYIIFLSRYDSPEQPSRCLVYDAGWKVYRVKGERWGC